MSRFRLSVCPHDTAKNSVGWFFLNTYLQRKLNCAIRFEPKDSFIQERADVLAGDYHVVYANPFSAAVFIQQLGFVPVARPMGLYDEAVLVRHADTAQAAHRPLRVASATDQLIIHALGLTLLERQGIAPDSCVFDFVGTHVKAANAVVQGKADLAFVYNETWNGLAQLTRQSLVKVDETNSASAYHCFCVAPAWADRAEALCAALCGLKDDEKGRALLADLHFPLGFEPLSLSDMQRTLQLVAVGSAPTA